MVKFLITSNTSAKIVKIIQEAERELMLITPYIKLAQIFYDRLVEADNRNVNIKLVYGKEEKLNQEDLEKIKKLKHLKLYFCENLHAKCYFNEKLMVLTSMNLHEYSQTNNREMGVQIKCDVDEDKELFHKAKEEADFIIQKSKLLISRSKDEEKEVEITLNAEDQKLYKDLKSFRFITSKKEKVPAYWVFHDSELKNIASQRPKTKEELLNIKGIAIKKYEKYGEDVLKIVNEFKS
ncbi:unnamed protein product [marine sediment metagenome]|uniref:HRDC domain-containing protein n=1 Tax=marine sediment metagenome TaxID=412755 RepID=X1RQH0_9ZZZZ